jgi:Uma2 family endonuclease
MTTVLAPPRPTRRRTAIARKRQVRIGPADHGRRMSLDQFADAIAQEGYLYELNKGVIEVSGIPNIPHGQMLQELRDQLTVYRVAHRDRVNYIGGGSDAKVLIEGVESERHPDLSVYLSPPPVQTRDAWSLWVPAIVIEVVSESSTRRDYEEMPAEYLAFGVAEYWIIDGQTRRMTANTRWRGQWKPRVLRPSQKYVTPLLPGFALDLKRVFAAGR